MMEKEMYDVNKIIMFDEFYSCNNIYVDIQFIKDIFLGVILLNIKTEEQYNNFINEIKNDPYRIIEDPSIVFPSIKFSKFEYLDFLQNKNNHSNIFKISPLTSFEEKLVKLIKRIAGIKKKIDDEYIPLNVYFNIYPIYNISKDLLDKFKAYFIKRCLCDMEITFLFEPIDNLKEKILDFKMLFIYDLKKFFDNKYYSSLFTDMKFLDKSIMSPKILYDNSVIAKYGLYDLDLEKLANNEKVKNEFDYNDHYLNYLCQFDFITPFSIKGEIING